MACVSASMPVVAVRLGGKSSVIFASRIASRGMSTKSLIGYFSCVMGLEMTAATVASLPVPAVVGMATRYGILQSTLSVPRISVIGVNLLAIRIPTPLAQSIAEPPPKASSALQPHLRYKSVASLMLLIVGFGMVLS